MLRIHLFGKAEIYGPHEQRVTLATRKVEQLLAYLWLHRNQPQARERLAGLLWPESSEEKARLSLRHALHDLKKAFESSKEPSVLLLNRTSAQFNPKAHCWVDAQEFEQRIDQVEDCKGDKRARLLQEAASLYRGDFLEDCYDDWCLEARDYLKNFYLKTLQGLVVYHAERKEYEQAISYAKLILSIDPLQEEIHRQLMYLHYAMGNRNAAIQEYRDCERVLKQELEVEPLPETQALFKEIEKRVSTDKLEELAIRARQLIRQYPELGAPFVGRAKECQRLMAAWELAVQGKGQAILVGGEAGIGKTRLVQEMISYVARRGGWPLTGRCYEIEGRLPYQPWIEVFRQAFSNAPSTVFSRVSPLWLGEIMKLVPELTERFPAVKQTASLLSPEQERNRLFEALTQVLLHLSREQPLLLFLDDLQWVDESTLQYAHYLLRRLSNDKILLLGTYRVEEVSEEHPLWELIQHSLKEGLVETFQLQPLSETDVRELVSGMLKAETGPGELLERFHQGTQGNPFFVVELLKSLIESGTMYLDQKGAWQLAAEKFTLSALPPTVKAVVETRLRRISRPSRDLLELASTRTRAFDADFLTQVSGQRKEDLLSRLEEILKAYFLAEEGSQYHFRHDILREVIYQSMLPERRRQFHLKVGQALEALQLQPGASSELMGEIAQHFYEAGEWPKALEYSLRAGQQVWSKSYAKEEAVYFYDRALKLSERLNDQQGLMRAYKELGEVFCLTDKYDEGLQYSLKALELSKDPEERADIYCAIANVYHYKRDFVKALSYCKKALVELGAKSQSLAIAKACDRASSCLNWLLRYDEAIPYCERALAILMKTPNDALAALILATLGHSYSGKGNYEKAIEHLTRAASLAEKTGDLYTIGNTFFSLALAYYNGGHVDPAIEAWTNSLQAVEKLGNPTDIVAIHNRLTIAYMRKGEIDRALQFAHKHLESSTRSADATSIAASYGMLGCLYDCKGSHHQAEEFFSQALGLAPKEGLMYHSVIVTYLYLASLEKALDWFERGFPHLKERQIEYYKTCPAFTPFFDRFRQHPRFRALAYGHPFSKQ